MRHFQYLGFDYHNVPRVLDELDRHPELWDERPFRTRGGPQSPFDGTSDIWVRWREPVELTSPEAFCEPHFPVFYPAWHLLPSLRPMVFRLMATVEATHLGGILITRVPPGGEIKPHNDCGTWHAEFHRVKVYIPLKTNDRVQTWCEDETLVMKTGEFWQFDNLVMHGLRNMGDEERISAIVCMRVEP